MLSRKYRLPATTSFARAQFARTPLFSFKVQQNGLTLTRCGFVVRKSVDKSSVARNRIRRLFRSCIEELYEQIAPGYDMLFFLEKGIIDKQQKELSQEVQSFLRQKNLLS